MPTLIDSPEQSTTRSNRARHRADGRAVTPLTTLTQAAAENMSTVARTGAIAMVSGGLLASAFTPTATAAPIQNGVTEHSVDRTVLPGATIQLQSVVTVAPETILEVEQAPSGVTPYALTPAGIAEAKAKAEAEARARAEAEAAARAEAEAAARAEAAAQAAAEAEAAAATAAATTTTATVSTATGSGVGQQAVNLALELVGTPYVYGEESPSTGFDCSGLIWYVYNQLGVSLPRTSSDLRYAGTVVSLAEARPGDIVWTSGHVALYAGNGMIVEASKPGTPVRYVEMWQSSPVIVRVA